MDPVVRPVKPHEHSKALALWQTVFHCAEGYFERYFSEADPWHQPGDTLGAWVGDELVSAVHICRRPLQWDDVRYLCGSIANVATLPDHRRQGLSRHLLQQAIVRMEQGNFDFSLLETGISGFYAALGWRIIPLPRFSITIESALAITGNRRVAGALAPAGMNEQVRSDYARVPRPLQLDRPPAYAEGWTGWNWRQASASMLSGNSGGYAIVQPVSCPDQSVRVMEWRSADAASEESLLRDAVAWARTHAAARIDFAALPQFTVPGAFESLGAANRTTSTGTMIRNIRLPESQWIRVHKAYESGAASWWPADDY